VPLLKEERSHLSLRRFHLLRLEARPFNHRLTLACRYFFNSFPWTFKVQWKVQSFVPVMYMSKFTHNIVYLVYSSYLLPMLVFKDMLKLLSNCQPLGYYQIFFIYNLCSPFIQTQSPLLPSLFLYVSLFHDWLWLLNKLFYFMNLCGVLLFSQKYSYYCFLVFTY
jgi:hypothetical protein